MLRLYLDCDGVILDTINKSYQILRERNIVKEHERRKFYIDTNWDELIKISGEIDNSISKIKILTNYFDIKILTHVNSDKEASAKISYFKKVLPEIEVIIVPKNIEKANMLDPNGTLLVDDYYPNLEKWKEKGGIPVKFSDSGKEYDYITIHDLLDLLKIDFKNKVKIKE